MKRNFLMFVLATSIGSTMYGQNTAALLENLKSKDPAVRSTAFYKVVASPVSGKSDTVNVAIINLLTTETAYLHTLSSDDEGYVTYYSNVVAYVAALNDLRALTPLMDVIDTGNMVTQALAAFGQPALDLVITKL